MDPADYLLKNPSKRDPQLQKLVNESNRSAIKSKTTFDQPPTLKQLKTKLFETEILPIKESVKTDLKSFWADIQQKSEPVLIGSSEEYFELSMLWKSLLITP